MEEALKYFFSYAREDSEFALRLAKDLRAVGVPVWLDQLDIYGGQRWDRAVEEALDSSQGLVAVLTPESLASNNVMDEVSFALEKGKLVVPILLRPCTIPFRLRRVQHVNFTADYPAAFRVLLRSLNIDAAAADLDSLPSAREQAQQREATAEAQRKAREEEERIAREELQRKAQAAEQERGEADRKARGEADRIAREKRERDEAEEAERAQAERKTREEAQGRKAREDAERAARAEAERIAGEAQRAKADEARKQAQEDEERSRREVETARQAAGAAKLEGKQALSGNKTKLIAAAVPAVLLIVGIGVGVGFRPDRPSDPSPSPASPDSSPPPVKTTPSPPPASTPSPSAPSAAIDDRTRNAAGRTLDGMVAMNAPMVTEGMAALRNIEKPVRPSAAATTEARALNEDGKAEFARATRDEGTYAEALRLFESAYTLDPGNAEYAGNAGTAAMRLGRPAAAETHFLRALAANPERALTWQELGILKVSQGDRDRAAASFAVSLTVSKNLKAAQDNLFVLLFREKVAAEIETKTDALWKWARTAL